MFYAGGSSKGLQWFCKDVQLTPRVLVFKAAEPKRTAQVGEACPLRDLGSCR